MARRENWETIVHNSKISNDETHGEDNDRRNSKPLFWSLSGIGNHETGRCELHDQEENVGDV